MSRKLTRQDVQDGKRGKWMKIADVPDGGLLLTIKSATMESTKGQNGDGAQDIPALSFTDNAQLLSLGPIRFEQMEKGLGDDPEEWTGKQVHIMVGSVEIDGEAKPHIDIAAIPAIETAPELAGGEA